MGPGPRDDPRKYSSTTRSWREGIEVLCEGAV